MTTQSLRGMANHGPMHWRGDRTGGLDAPSAQPTAARSTSRRRSRSSTPRSTVCSAASTSLSERRDAGVRRASSSRSSIRPTRCATWTAASRPDQAAGRTLLLQLEAVRRRRHVQLLPRAQSGVGILRRRRRRRWSSRRRSRSRTCATRTRRSACSACRWSRASSASTPATTASSAIRCAASASRTTAASTRSSASSACRASIRPAATRAASGGCRRHDAAPPGRAVRARLRQRTWRRSSASRSRRRRRRSTIRPSSRASRC